MHSGRQNHPAFTDVIREKWTLCSAQLVLSPSKWLPTISSTACTNRACAAASLRYAISTTRLPTNMMRHYINTTVLCIALNLASGALAAGYQENHSSGDPESEVTDCKLQTTPLMRCSLYSDYEVTDATLNKLYKSLIANLKSDQVASLRATQRQWITFRARRCEEMQAAVSCENSQCVGVEHDMCILEVTEKRSKELADFIKDTQSAAARNFRYSKVYPEPFD